MPEQAKKLTNFINTVVQEATADAERTLGALEAQRTAALAYAERIARREAAQVIRVQAARVRAEAGQQVSRHLMDCKREIYLRRTQISREVFARVRERLAEFTASPEYLPRLTAQLRQALEALGPAESVCVFLRREDMAFSDALAEAAGPVAAEFRTGDFTLGGLIVDCPAQGRRVDGSYDAAMDDLSGRFAELFGLSLTDDLAGAEKEADHD